MYCTLQKVEYFYKETFILSCIFLHVFLINAANRISREAQKGKRIFLLSILLYNLPTIASRIECMAS